MNLLRCPESKVDPESLRFEVSLNLKLSTSVPCLLQASDAILLSSHLLRSVGPPTVVVGLYKPLLAKSVDLNTLDDPPLTSLSVFMILLFFDKLASILWPDLSNTTC